MLLRRTIQDVGNILGSLYLSMLFLGIINSRTIQPVASNERAVSLASPLQFPNLQALMPSAEITFSLVSVM